MRNIYDNLNPGGYVEFTDSPILFQSVDNSLDGTALRRWNDLLLEGNSFNAITYALPTDHQAQSLTHDQPSQAWAVNPWPLCT